MFVIYHLIFQIEAGEAREAEPPSLEQPSPPMPPATTSDASLSLFPLETIGSVPRLTPFICAPPSSSTHHRHYITVFSLAFTGQKKEEKISGGGCIDLRYVPSECYQIFKCSVYSYRVVSWSFWSENNKQNRRILVIIIFLGGWNCMRRWRGEKEEQIWGGFSDGGCWGVMLLFVRWLMEVRWWYIFPLLVRSTRNHTYVSNLNTKTHSEDHEPIYLVIILNNSYLFL